MTFTALLAALAAPSDEAMAAPWLWPGHTGEALQLRDAHWRAMEAERAALVEAPAPATEAQAILGEAQAAWGDLRGLLAGQPADALDGDPGGGEWTLRQTLAHVLLTERRYRLLSAHAAHRAGGEPIRIPVPAELEPGEDADGPEEWIDRLEAERARSDADLSNLPPAALLQPTIWAGHPVDVRFRLHRFASHIAEHTIQAEKVLRALGRPPSEALQVTRRLSALRGAHERRTPPEALRRLTAAHAALLPRA